MDAVVHILKAGLWLDLIKNFEITNIAHIHVHTMRKPPRKSLLRVNRKHHEATLNLWDQFNNSLVESKLMILIALKQMFAKASSQLPLIIPIPPLQFIIQNFSTL